MSKHDDGNSSASFWQLIIVIPGAILAFTVFISLLAHFFKPAVPVKAEIEESIKPVAEVEVAAADNGVHVNKSGEEVAKSVCIMCHEAGLMQAPIIGNKDQWAPRIAQGYETLVKHAIEGIRSMPARGGNAELTDVEVANAVVYMTNASGAKFEEVKPAEAEAAPADEAKPAAEPAPAVEAAPAS